MHQYPKLPGPHTNHSTICKRKARGWLTKKQRETKKRKSKQRKVKANRQKPNNNKAKIESAHTHSRKSTTLAGRGQQQRTQKLGPPVGEGQAAGVEIKANTCFYYVTRQVCVRGRARLCVCDAIVGECKTGATGRASVRARVCESHNSFLRISCENTSVLVGFTYNLPHLTECQSQKQQLIGFRYRLPKTTVQTEC